MLEIFIFWIFLFLSFAQAEISFTAEGAVKVGPATDTCESATLGAFRWSSTNTCMEVCNGTLWQCVSVAACADNLPDSFTLTDLNAQTTSTLVTSNIVQVNGFSGCTVEVSVSGDGTPEYRTCTDSSCSSLIQDWTTNKSSFTEGNYVQVRMTTAAAGGLQRIANLVVGARTVNWSTTTAGACTDPNPPGGTVCADGTVYVGLSPDGNVKMYATRCDGGMSWDGSSCTGVRLSMPWSADNNIFNGINDLFTGESNTAAIVALSNADGPYYAADFCDNLNIHGHSDWYLPARNEAQTLATTACGILPDWGCSDTRVMWNSSEGSSGTGGFIRKRGDSGSTTKTASFNVRCVRK